MRHTSVARTLLSAYDSVPMTTIDPEQEHRRLTELYANMPPEELAKVFGDAASLTESAWQALAGEMKHRGLTVPAEQPGGPGIYEAEQRPLVMIRRFRDLPAALLAKGCLESAGIESFLTDDNMVRMDWFYSNLISGIKLLVDEANVEEATTVLNEPIPDAFEVEGVGAYEQPHCPRCKSLDVNFEESDKLAYVAMFVSVPIPFYKRGWSCRSCGYQWQDPVEENADDDALERDQL
jgi:transposase-like protein